MPQPPPDVDVPLYCTHHVPLFLGKHGRTRGVGEKQGNKWGSREKQGGGSVEAGGSGERSRGGIRGEAGRNRGQAGQSRREAAGKQQGNSREAMLG